MSLCSKCGGEFPDAELMMTANGAVCRQCYAAAETPKPKVNPKMGLSGLTVGAVPFFIHFRIVTSTTLNIVALALGPIALGMGIAQVVKALKIDDAKSKQTALAVGAIAILLGIYQTVHGVGIV